MDFDVGATGWDTDRRIERAKIISDEIAKAIDIKAEANAGINAGTNVLEFGCGTGLTSFWLRDRFDHITLVDSSEGMINELKKKIKEAGITNMTAICADITRMDGFKEVNAQTFLTKDRFNIIYTSMALHHIADVGAVLKILYGLLRDNGTICIVDLTADDGSFHSLEKDFNGHNGFEQQDLKAVLEDAGFTDVRTRVFYEDTKRIEDREVPYSLFIMTGSKQAGG